MKRRQKILRFLLKALAALFSVLMIAAAGFLLVLAQPKKEDTAPPAPQPLLSASPALNISSEREIRTLVERFPVPVLSFMSGSGLVFVSGSAADAGLKGGFGRVTSLYWQTQEGEPLLLQSIYPASALSLLEGGGYHFSASAGPTLFGADSVRMENADTVRIHAATETGLYVVTVPRSLAPELSRISRSLQLFSVPRESGKFYYKDDYAIITRLISEEFLEEVRPG